jgi:hypothetical protein
MHIGKHIKAQFDRQPKSHNVQWLAEQLNCDRRNVYDIFTRASIDTGLLLRISRVLDYNFLSDLSSFYINHRDEI